MLDYVSYYLFMILLLPAIRATSMLFVAVFTTPIGCIANAKRLQGGLVQAYSNHIEISQNFFTKTKHAMMHHGYFMWFLCSFHHHIVLPLRFPFYSLFLAIREQLCLVVYCRTLCIFARDCGWMLKRTAVLVQVGNDTQCFTEGVLIFSFFLVFVAQTTNLAPCPYHTASTIYLSTRARVSGIPCCARC